MFFKVFSKRIIKQIYQRLSLERANMQNDNHARIDKPLNTPDWSLHTSTRCQRVQKNISDIDTAVILLFTTTNISQIYISTPPIFLSPLSLSKIAEKSIPFLLFFF